MRPNVCIGKFAVQNYGRPFVVAEVGINHNGEIEKAYKLISLAKKSGADAVKFQTFKAEEFVSDKNQKFTYKSRGKIVTESMLEMFKRYEFSEKQWKLIKKKCDSEGIMFLSTPQNASDLKLLLNLGVAAVKVGSDDFSNIPLLKTYAKTGLPLILSSGMSDMSEVRRAVNAVGGDKGYPTVLLVCTSQYPTPPADANLLRISTLAAAFPAIPIGFSDHTQGPLASALAVSLGASFFEKHITLSHDLPGPDHWFSEDPLGIVGWIKSIRTAHLMTGDGKVKPTAGEKLNKKEFQRVVVALVPIERNAVFTTENIGMRRVPGGKGRAGRFYESFLGRHAKRSYRKGQPVFL